jgi:hypothetical protein
MLRRRLNENSLFENQEAKSIDAAKRFLIDNNLIRPQNVDWYIRIEVRDKIPSLKTKLGGKFILGCTRITFPMDAEEDDDFMSNMSYIDRIIRRIVDAHYDEYDRDFNGLGFDELVNEFNDELKEELENEKRVIKSLRLKKNPRYEIKKINLFEDAEEFYQASQWCVCDNIDQWWSYTLGNKTPMYFCLRDDYEDLDRVPGASCPLDDYGLSMIAVGVNEDGSLNTCTCRWNHEHGASGMCMDAVELSELLGIDVYEVMRPNKN